MSEDLKGRPVRDAAEATADAFDAGKTYIAGALTDTTLAFKGIFDRVNAFIDAVTPHAKAAAERELAKERPTT